MKLKYNVEDRLPAGALAVYSLQWFVLCIAVVATSVFVAQGTPEERLFYAQKLFAVMGIAGLIQVIWGHRLPLVVGPAAVLLVGVMSALSSSATTDGIYTSIAIGGVITTLLTIGSTMRYIQRLFTPRIIVVILMLIAFTLTPTISQKLIFAHNPTLDPHILHDQHIFGLVFALIGTFAMVALNRTLKGVAKSLIIPAALIVGSVAFFALFGMPEKCGSAASLDNMFIGSITLDWGLILAFVVCYIALSSPPDFLQIMSSTGMKHQRLAKIILYRKVDLLPRVSNISAIGLVSSLGKGCFSMAATASASWPMLDLGGGVDAWPPFPLIVRSMFIRPFSAIPITAHCSFTPGKTFSTTAPPSSRTKDGTMPRSCSNAVAAAALAPVVSSSPQYARMMSFSGTKPFASSVSAASRRRYR